MMNVEISGWVQDELPLQQERVEQLHQIVNNIVKRNGQQRSYSLCQKRDECRIKSNLISDKENKSQMIKSIKPPLNKIQELKKVMEFLQHNESFKYSTHRTFDLNDPKYQPKYQQFIDEKKKRLRLQLQNHNEILTNQQDNQQIIQQPPKSKLLIPILQEQQQQQQQNKKQNTRRQLSIPHQTIEDDYPKNKETIKFKFGKFIIQQKNHKQQYKHCQTDISEQFKINRIFSKQDINPQIEQNRTNYTKIQTPKTMITKKSKSHLSYEGLVKNGYQYLNEIRDKQRQLRLMQLTIKGIK